MSSSQHEQNKNLSYRHTLAQLFATSTASLRRLNFASWLRMALVFTIVTGGLLVAFFGITVRVDAATSTRFTPAAPPPLGCTHERSCSILSQ